MVDLIEGKNPDRVTLCDRDGLTCGEAPLSLPTTIVHCERTGAIHYVMWRGPIPLGSAAIGVMMIKDDYLRISI